MHEIHLINNLIEDLIRAANKEYIKKITKIYISIGRLTEITPDSLKLLFADKSKGTIAESADIEIQSCDIREIRLISFDGE